MTDATTPTSNDRLADLERQLVEREATHQRDLTHAELKTLAVRAGMVDLDGLKLLDLTTIKRDAKGEIENADRIMTDLMRAKPWLFPTANSSATSPTPPSTPPIAKPVTAMSHKEWQAARTELLRRR
jgi:hypothetical protein